MSISSSRPAIQTAQSPVGPRLPGASRLMVSVRPPRRAAERAADQVKSCTYCGLSNDDAAIRCAGCGTDEFKNPTAAPPPLPAATPEADLRLRDILTDASLRFRALVVASTASYLILFFHPWITDRFLSQAAADALAWEGYGALLPLPPSMNWLFMLLYSAVAMGLWNFSKSARLVFTLLSAFWLLDVLLAGIQVRTAFDSFLFLASSMADGAILASAYTSPVKERFE